MRRGLVAVLAALAWPGAAVAAGPCGLPDRGTAWVDYASLEVEKVLARPGVIAAPSTGEYPARLRAAGATTVYWDMNLNNRVGTPTAPADGALIEERANRLFDFAAQQTACPTPWIALNELFGAHLETPWTPNNAQYRANVLTLVRTLAGRGARPFLLISNEPYIGSDEAAAWWRAVAQVSDIVPEVYFHAGQLYAQGPILANRRLRAAYRRNVARLVAIGIPVTRIGLMLGFQSGPGTGGREGLEPRHAWFEVIKWQALSARQVSSEMKLASVWSWGWGTFSAAGADPDKADAACVYLWARDRRLCNGPKVAGEKFNASRTQGQLILPSGAMCTLGPHRIGMAAIARLNVLVQDRDVAYSVLLSRIAESRRARVTTKEVLAAERAVVQSRFGGSKASYRAALARERATLGVARSILADAIRRRKIGRTLRVPRPSLAAITGFYVAYGDLRVRPVRVESGAPAWLGGRRTGLALETFVPASVFAAPAGRTATVRTLTGRYAVRPVGPARLLGEVPLAQARPAIAAALRQFARSDRAVQWSAAQQEQLVRQAVCRRDDLPMPAVVDLRVYLPFLQLEA